jgi:hypothetical protein
VTAAAATQPDTALQRALILLSVVLATTLYATTLTIANVALPQMQGEPASQSSNLIPRCRLSYPPVV